MATAKSLPAPSFETTEIRADGVRVGDLYPWPTRDFGLRACEISQIKIKPRLGRGGKDLIQIDFAQGFGVFRTENEMVKVWLMRR